MRFTFFWSSSPHLLASESSNLQSDCSFRFCCETGLKIDTTAAFEFITLVAWYLFSLALGPLKFLTLITLYLLSLTLTQRVPISWAQESCLWGKQMIFLR